MAEIGLDPWQDDSKIHILYSFAYIASDTTKENKWWVKKITEALQKLYNYIIYIYIKYIFKNSKN